MTSGIEIHANILATLAGGAYIRAQSWLTSLPMVLVFGAVLGAVYERLNRIRRAWVFFAATSGLFLVHHFCWKFVCFESFRYWNWRIEMLAMLFLGLFHVSREFCDPLAIGAPPVGGSEVPDGRSHA